MALPQPEKLHAEAPAAPHPGEQPKDLPPGWHAPLPEKIPELTYWPAALAFGVVLIFWGLLTSFLVSLVGLLVLVVSLAGWIGAMRHENG